MKVTLIGWTAFRMPEFLLDSPFAEREEMAWLSEDRELSKPADALAELAGRICYDSYTLPNPTTATNEGYLGNILKQRHFSVLEHASASFIVQGVSRSLLMEMRTHRHASFSARSTRYVDESEADLVVPPALVEFTHESLLNDGVGTIGKDIESFMDHAVGLYSAVVDKLISEGATRKEAREAAREFLPGATQTEFVVTANHHAWREILGKRLAPGAAREIRELHQIILGHLQLLAPNIYQDIQCP